VGGGVEWVGVTGGGDAWVGVGVGVTAGVRVTIGAARPVELEPALELDGLVTGVAWVVTGPETCVEGRAGALAGA
jgi:hypothetical protein